MRWFLLLMLIFFLQVSHSQPKEPETFQPCKACHTIGDGRLIGPDLKGVTERRDTDWLISFIRSSQTMIENGDELAVQLFNEYNKVPMPDNDLTDAEIMEILEYIENYEDAPEPTSEAVKEEVEVLDKSEQTEGDVEGTFFEFEKSYGPGNLQTPFYVFLALLLISIIDLVITRIVRVKFVHIIIILVSVFVIGEIMVVEARHLGRQQGYQPDQPVDFSHKVHVAQNNIDCQYCHHTVNESKHAGFPSTDLCMNCHNVVRKGSRTGTEEIAKIYESQETGMPIRWIKVHNLPDHVFFSHAQHVAVGKIECQTCHGPVETMDQIVQVNTLSMGWCVNCHRETEVQFTENPYYETHVKLHEQLKSNEINRVTVEMIGGNNCQMCHY